ncbi:MAG: NADH-quinone oxidoreductase subunit H [Candidatus Micrarchaeota archaeon]|nr:MAG: NADH-quinone oxidoreductase subunit H [Candidatus Micrarchaeota archaeon]
MLSPFINSIYGYINGILRYYTSQLLASSISAIIAALIFTILLSILLTFYAVIYGWVERKLLARAHSRHGPTYVGKFGILQNIADVIKLLSKEHITPKYASRGLFFGGILAVAALTVFSTTILPLSPYFYGLYSNYSLLIIFLTLAVSPLLIFIVGWVSGNKFSSIASQRSIVVLVSFESVLLITLVAISLNGGFNIIDVVEAQSNIWNIIRYPILFIVFLIALLAELERPPFDFREADSELIAGWLVDVSPRYYAIALLVDYIRLYMGSLLITDLFLGGWLGPVLPALVWSFIKLTIVTLLIIFIRVTFFRSKIDRVVKIGWVYLLPLAVINLLASFLFI